MEEQNLTFGQLLKKTRALYIGPTKLSSKTRMNRRHLDQFEKDEIFPPDEVKLRRICDAIGCTDEEYWALFRKARDTHIARILSKYTGSGKRHYDSSAS